MTRESAWVSNEPPRATLRTPTQEPEVNTTVNHTPLAARHAGSITYVPAHCSSLIPVLLPQKQGGGPYAVYLQPSSPRPNPLARPQPTSFVVRSMTFEDKTAQYAAKSQTASMVPDISPLVQKRLRSDSASESSPPKTKKTDPNLKVKRILIII